MTLKDTNQHRYSGYALARLHSFVVAFFISPSKTSKSSLDCLGLPSVIEVTKKTKKNIKNIIKPLLNKGLSGFDGVSLKYISFA